MALKEKMEKIAADLMNLEVNTIVKDNILGTKMPETRHALVDIAKDYGCKLRQIENPAATPDEITRDLKQIKGGKATFKGFSSRVEQLVTTRISQSDLWVLDRIRDMSGQIAGRVFLYSDNDYTRDELNEKRPPKMRLDPEEVVLVRKAWEMGTEKVAMQTVIQLDGDVVTRVQPEFAAVPSHPIHDIHRQGTRVAVEFWNNLVLLLKDIVGGMFGRFWTS